MSKRSLAYIKLISSMLIFGSIGLFVRYIQLPSGIISFVRAFIGVAFLLIIILIKGSGISITAIRENLLCLVLSGTAIGFNWILLFESYRYTTVAVSTLCYYMAPVIVTLLAPFILREKLSGKRAICAGIALVGMILISGIFTTSVPSVSTIKGILLGLAAAVLYATVILLNKQLRDISAFDRTVVQLLISAVVLLPYNLVTTDIGSLNVFPNTLLLLAVVGVIHTGLAYFLYFGSMEDLSSQSIAVASYIDPVVAVIASVSLLREPFDIYAMLGAVAILGAAVVSELPQKGKILK